MLEIKTSLDWALVESELKQLGTMLPEFSSDIRRFRSRIAEQVKELGLLEVEARRLKSNIAQKRCIEKAEQINSELKQLSKFHLMSMLHKA